MKTDETLPSLYSLTVENLRSELQEYGLPKYSSDQVFDWVYKKLEFDPNQWTNVGKRTKAFILEKYDLTLPKPVYQQESKDGTMKFLLMLKDGQTVESVVIPGPSRLTQCLSTQVGCAIKCTFCHTATMGLKRHMSTGEIVGQYLAVNKAIASKQKKITNLVYMGQGEPLHNYESTKQATEIFLDGKCAGFGQRKVTLSTSGLVPQIEKLGEFPPVNIAISLHSARDDVRSELMPINKVYDLKRLFKAIKMIPLKAHRRITYEYLLIDGLNNSSEDVQALCDLLTRSESKINLIPFNEYPGSSFKRPSNAKNMWFMDQLCKRGFTATIRATKGDDILAACGQLKSKIDKEGVSVSV